MWDYMSNVKLNILALLVPCYDTRYDSRIKRNWIRPAELALQNNHSLTSFTCTCVKHDFHMRWYLTEKQQVVHVWQELLTLPGYITSGGIRVAQSLIVCVIFCRLLFVCLSFFVFPLCCQSFFDLRLPIAPLESSNIS